MPTIEQLLRDLDLTDIESQIFLLCQKYGSLSVSGLTRLLNLPRSTIHDNVEKLAVRSYLITSKGTKGNMYSALTPDELIALLKGKKHYYQEMIEKVEIMKPTLLELWNQNKYIPKIQYYEGRDSIKLIYDRIANAQERYFISDMDTIFKDMGRTPEQTAKEFSHTNGFGKSILVDTPGARKYAKLLKMKNHTNKFIKLPANEILNSDTILIDGTYIHISYLEYIVAIEINNPIFYQTQKILFDKLWEVAGK